jgi:hypothetical protein
MSLSDTAIRSFKPEQKLIHKQNGHGLFLAGLKLGYIDIHSTESGLPR